MFYKYDNVQYVTLKCLEWALIELNLAETCNHRHVSNNACIISTFRGPFIVIYSYNKTNEFH